MRVGHGESLLLVTVLACFLGGVDPFGGFGRVAPVFLSLLILQTLSSGLNLLGANQHLATAVWGLFLIAVMVFRFSAPTLRAMFEIVGAGDRSESQADDRGPRPSLRVSFPRKRESRAPARCGQVWMPAFAGHGYSRPYDSEQPRCISHIGGANEVRHLLFVLGAGVERRLPEIRGKGRQARIRRHRDRCSSSEQL